MTVLDRHLAREFLRLFALTLAGFVSLFLVIEFFEKLRMLLRYQASFADSAWFFAARLPWMVAQVIPMAALLATVLSLTVLARHGEITAMRCGGISVRRLAAPYLACGLALAALHAFIQEVAAPRGFAQAREIELVHIKGRGARALLKTEDLWLRTHSGVVHVGRVEEGATVLHEVAVAELTDSRVTRRIDAQQARWDGTTWRLLEAEVRWFGADGMPRTEHLAEAPYPLQETPADFNIPKRTTEEESWSELRGRIQRYRRQGLEASGLEVDLWAKTSLPFVTLLMPLLAFPFGLRAGRRGSTSAGIVLAIVLGFGYWLVLAVGLSLGKVGVLPPPLAAWAGNLLFAGVGIALLARAEVTT